MEECLSNNKNVGISSSSNKTIRIFLELIKSGEECPLTGSGSSMRPFLRDENDILIMKQVDRDKIKVGDIYLYQRADETYVIHRLYKHELNETLSFIGDNQYYLEKGIKLTQLKAKAKCVIRNGRVISCEHGCLHTFYILRMKLRVLFSRIRLY